MPRNGAWLSCQLKSKSSPCFCGLSFLCCPQISHVETLTPIVVAGRWGLWGVIRTHEGRAIMGFIHLSFLSVSSPPPFTKGRKSHVRTQLEGRCLQDRSLTRKPICQLLDRGRPSLQNYERYMSVVQAASSLALLLPQAELLQTQPKCFKTRPKLNVTGVLPLSPPVLVFLRGQNHPLTCPA